MGVKQFFFIVFFTCVSLGISAQSEYVRHTVQPGETVYSIAKKYQVTEADLIKYNPDIAQGLTEGTVLILPKNAKAAESKNERTGEDYFYHTVEAKETIYGLCKKYNVTEAQLLAANPDLKDGLKVGATIIIPVNKSEVIGGTEIRVDKDFIYHTVEPKETVYSICKAAGISESEFLNLNPEVREKGLQIGQVIKLPKNSVKEEVPTDQSKTKDYGLYRVLEGDDLASIARKYNTTKEEILELNPELATGLTVGKYIVVPSKEPKATPSVAMPTKLNDFFWNLPEPGVKPKLHFAVVLPLYLSANDSIDLSENGSRAKVFEKSITAIQFLAGFLTAMDTLAGLGYEIELDIYDSQNDLNVIRSIARKIDRSVDAIIGPLYSKNAELMASILKDIPVISPLSKALENSDKPNLVNCVANQQSEYLAMASIVRQNPNGNVVFLNGKAKGNKEAIKYVKSYLPIQDTSLIHTVWVTESFNMTNHLTPFMAEGKKTIVIVVDENPVFISDLFTKLKNFRDSSVLLVTTSKIFDINTLENRYLNNQNFVGLSTEYINYSDTCTQLFIKKFRVKTATEPNKYAFSGYDAGLYFAQLLAAFNGLPMQSEWPNIKGTSKGFFFSGGTK